MINIPTTDIMTPITGDADKAVKADRPNKDEVSFLGVINAGFSGADEQDDIFGPVPNAKRARNDGNPNLAAIITVTSDTVLLPIQHVSDQTALDPENMTKGKIANFTSVEDGNEILKDTLPDHSDSHRVLPVDPHMMNTFGFVANQSAKTLKVAPHIVNKEDDSRTAKNSMLIPETVPPQQMENAGHPVREPNPQADQESLQSAITAERPILQPGANSLQSTQTLINGVKPETPTLAPTTNDRVLPAQAENSTSSRHMLNTHERPPHQVAYAAQNSPVQRPDIAPAPTEEPTPSAVLAPQPTTHATFSGPDTAPEIEMAMPPIPDKVAQLMRNPKPGSQFGKSKPAVPVTTHPSPINKTGASENVQATTSPKYMMPKAAQPQSNLEAPAQAIRQPFMAIKGEVTNIPSHSLVAKVADTHWPHQSTMMNSTPEVAAPETRQPTTDKLTSQIKVPEATLTEGTAPLAASEFVQLETRSIDVATPLRNESNLNRPEVMRHVAQQLTEAARHMPDSPVELALNPEELGRVRLTFTTTETSIHVAVVAERGETLEMMRRHIETLAQDFRDLGYRDVKFDFSGNGARSDAKTSGNESGDRDQNANPDAMPHDIEAPIQLSLEPSTGLDLRL